MPTPRVLHVLNDLSAGGAERLVLELCRRTRPEFGSEVITVAGSGPLAEAFAAANIPVLHGHRGSRTLGIQALAKISARIRHADVVHTHLFAGDTWGRLGATLAQHPAVVTTEHNIDRDETWQRSVRRVLSPVSRVVIAVSEAVARGCCGRDIRVIPNGVDLERYSAPWQGGGGILAIGRRVPQKGFDVLLRACDELQRRGSGDGGFAIETRRDQLAAAGGRRPLSVRIAGDGPDAPAHPMVEWLGARNDIPTLLSSADVLVIPSRWEGFGLVAVEGMAAGVPIVASEVDGLSEVVGEAGVLVPAGDAVALAAAIRQILNDRGLAAELSRRGRVRAGQFGIQRMVEGYKEIWREVLGKSPAR